MQTRSILQTLVMLSLLIHVPPEHITEKRAQVGLHDQLLGVSKEQFSKEEGLDKLNRVC